MGRFFLFIAVILLVSAGAVLAALALSLPAEVTFPVGNEIVAVHSGAAVIGVVVLGGILAIEADLMQGAPRAGLGRPLQQSFEFGRRQCEQPAAIWFLVHGDIANIVISQTINSSIIKPRNSVES